MSITRKAILIGSPSVKPELPGVKIDIEDIKKFLLSNEGGAWKSSEIFTLIDPSINLVNAHIALAKDADYVFITCSGHGEHQVGQSLSETVMHLNEKETIPIVSINPKNKRHLVIVDVCRNLVRIDRAKLFAESKFAKGIALDSAKMVIDYRKVFDDAVMNTAEGRIVAYSCDINQSAGDDGSGGVFTQALLNAPKRFSPTNNSYGIVNISQAFDVAKEVTYRENAPQSPVFNAGRRMNFFPFAIVSQ